MIHKRTEGLDLQGEWDYPYEIYPEINPELDCPHKTQQQPKRQQCPFAQYCPLKASPGSGQLPGHNLTSPASKACFCLESRRSEAEGANCGTKSNTEMCAV